MHLNDALTAGEFTDEGFVAASAATTSLRVTAPRPEAEGAEGGAPDPVEAMALAIYDHLSIDGQGPGYDSERQLKSDIRSRGIAVSDNKWPDAVAWLVSRNLLKRWKVGSGYHGRIIPKTETDQPQPDSTSQSVAAPNPTQS